MRDATHKNGENLKKMKNITKKQTRIELKAAIINNDITAVYKLAYKNGIDVCNEYDVIRFIESFETSVKRARQGARMVHYRQRKRYHCSNISNKRLDAIQWAKWQKKSGAMNTNYGKILIEGNTNIYWASPIYQHRDYNKSVAFSNTQKNRDLMLVINKYLQNG